MGSGGVTCGGSSKINRTFGRDLGFIDGSTKTWCSGPVGVQFILSSVDLSRLRCFRYFDLGSCLGISGFGTLVCRSLPAAGKKVGSLSQTVVFLWCERSDDWGEHDPFVLAEDGLGDRLDHLFRNGRDHLFRFSILLVTPPRLSPSSLTIFP